jgi:hypothetical protein
VLYICRLSFVQSSQLASVSSVLHARQGWPLKLVVVVRRPVYQASAGRPVYQASAGASFSSAPCTSFTIICRHHKVPSSISTQS